MLYHADVEQFMTQLRAIGVVDITSQEWQASPVQRQMITHAEILKTTIHRLGSLVAAVNVAPFATADEAVEAYNKALERHTQLLAERAKAESELDRLELWGEFDPDMVQRLRAERGITLRFFEIPSKRYDSTFETEYPIEIVSQRAGQTFFVLAHADGDPVVDIPGAQEFRAPTTSYAQQNSYVKELWQQEQQQEQIMARAALSYDDINRQYLELKDSLDFSRAIEAGESHADGTIRLVRGWSVADDRAKVEAFADTQQVIFTSEDGKIEDNPPVKLHNNFFARLFEPVGSLYMLPRYNELDMTPYFAPFFMIFFGMCFGDAGYGILFLLAIAVIWHKLPVKYRDYARFGIYLNVSTIFFGLLTGNFFGIELMKVPALVEFKEYFVKTESMFNVALGMGAVQILFGQILRIFNRIKRGGSFKYGLSAIGWVILFFALGISFLGFIPAFTMQSTAFTVVLAIAAVLILLFNSPGKNPLVNIGAGLYNCYEMATGVVGDLISYVRLFAIGLVGAIIAQIFNALSVGLSGDIPVLSWLMMAVILLIGHGLNIFISILGAFVHPVRLTFVEFFKNAEFEGGSRAFTPFKKRSIES